MKILKNFSENELAYLVILKGENSGNAMYTLRRILQKEKESPSRSIIMAFLKIIFEGQDLDLTKTATEVLLKINLSLIRSFANDIKNFVQQTKILNVGLEGLRILKRLGEDPNEDFLGEYLKQIHKRGKNIHVRYKAFTMLVEANLFTVSDYVELFGKDEEK
ncbi:MAG: hypothetical protein RI945_62 [Candidatus Parcubacteria bacterium]|jgi:hypothetical protein